MEDFPQYCTVLLMAEAGVDTFIQHVQFIKSAFENNEGVIYITTEKSPTEIKEAAASHGLNIDEHEGKNFLFIDAFSQESDNIYEKGMNISSLANLNEISIALDKTSGMLKKPLKIIFDSLSPVFLFNPHENVLRFVRNLIASTKMRYGLICYVIYEGVHDSNTENTLRYLVDSVIEMKFDENLKRKIRIHHIKGKEVDTSWATFNNEEGLKNE